VKLHGHEHFSNIQTTSVVHAPSCLMGTRVCYSPLGVGWEGGEGPKREVEHSPPSSVKVKNEWSYYYARSVSLHDMERDK
jgi:hypothetical protein